MELVEAQDYILGVLGSSPTGDITSLNPDAQAARARIKDNTTTLLKKGWWFNTDHNVLMEPAATSGEIALPANVLKVVPKYNQLVVQRGQRLYDSENNTYQFDAAITAHRIIDLEWDLLPIDAQDFVRFSAASELCSTELEDSNKSAEQGELAREAMFELKRAHLRTSKKNALQAPAARRILSRVNPYRRNRRG